MTDATEDAIDREEEWERLLALHIANKCNPYDCPFCNNTYKDELFR